MYLIINAGSTGTGKSTLIKRMLAQSSKFLIFDVQNEYDGIPIYNGKILPKMRFCKNDIIKFIDLVKRLDKGYNVFIEEATGFIKGRSSLDFIKLVLSKRHLKINFILNFHSLHRVPLDLVEFTDIIYLRKTGDLEKNVKEKFPDILETWKKVKKSPNKYEVRALYLSNLTEHLRNK